MKKGVTGSLKGPIEQHLLSRSAWPWRSRYRPSKQQHLRISVMCPHWDPVRLLGTSALAGINPEGRPRVDQTVTALKTGEAEEARLIYRVRHRENNEIWVETALRVTRDSQTNAIDGVFAISRDMTEQRICRTSSRRLPSPTVDWSPQPSAFRRPSCGRAGSGKARWYTAIVVAYRRRPLQEVQRSVRPPVE